MTQDSYFGQNGTIYLRHGTGSTTIPIGIIQNWKVDLSFDMNELYGMGSIVYQGIARSKMKVEVSCEFASFDVTNLKTLIDPTLGASATGPYTISQGSSGDTTQVDNTFVFEGQFEGQGGNIVQIVVEGVYFDNFPWDASSDDWVKLNLTGHGNSYSINPSYTPTPGNDSD